MPSLWEALRDTLYGQAAIGQGVTIESTSIALTGNQQAQLAHSAAAPADRPVWGWFHDPAGELTATFSNVRARPRSMHHEMLVFESVQFSDPTVILAPSLPDQRLPLEARFLIKRLYLPRGRVRGDHTYWPLPHNVDHSMALVFAYEVNSDAGTTNPVTAAVYDAPNFIPLLPSAASSPVRAEVGTTAQASIDAHHVVVVVSFVTCMERADFEPGGILGAGRFFPQVSVISTRALAGLESEIIITRPETSSHHGADMDAPVRAGMYTDTNELPTMRQNRLLAALSGIDRILLPYWDQIFDYLKVDNFPADRDYIVVSPTARARTISGAIEKLVFANGRWNSEQFLRVPAQSNAPANLFVYEAADVAKVARQGAFDSIHCAPGMAALEAVDWTMNRTGFERSSPAWQATLASIAMAPFCEHDCVHLHWRWGAAYERLAAAMAPNKRYLRGWQGDRPYMLAGAPMVPPNQRVTITVGARNMYSYKATIPERADAIRPGVWQYVCHHGGAYSLFIDDQDPRIAMLRAVIAGSSTGSPIAAVHAGDPPQTGVAEWATLYWNMRYQATRTGPMERIRIADLERCLG